MTKLRLGTRKSLLAWAQSSLVAEQLEQHHPGLAVELVGIITQGDRQTDKPLNQLDGKDFFVKELDDALLRRDIDFCVHSFKDLSLERPAGIQLAAVPQREDPRDIILFHSSRADRKLASGIPLRIGTSSPRRLHNIPPFLQRALPHCKDLYPQIEMLTLRGNVNTRLERLHIDDSDPRQLDGVVLAFAGISRLYSHDSSNSSLQQLLRGLRWMILPLSDNPTAPAQGALAIECRRNDARVMELLSCLDHHDTRRQIYSERSLMAEWGGGCHQRFGISVVTLSTDNEVRFTKGLLADGRDLSELDASRVSALPVNAWDGSLIKAATMSATKPIKIKAAACFVASPRAATQNELLQQLKTKRVWVSGVQSWFGLAQHGIWVEGCADGIGIQSIQRLLAKPVLSLPSFREFAVLTHRDAVADWQHAEVHATYSVDYSGISEDVLQALRDARDIYWSSGSQFRALNHFCSPAAVHACGAGKTNTELRSSGLEPRIFVDAKQWRVWLNERDQKM